MSWHVAIGFRRADDALRARIQHELDTLGPWLEEIEAKYGFPGGAPVRLAAATDKPILLAAAGAVTGILAQADAPAGAPAGAPAVKAPASNAADVSHGRELFNSTCSHCHGPDAASPEKRIDLRRLVKRYGEKMDEVFATTVHHGRLDKGMPSWQDVISEDDIASIKVFVDSVQESK